MRKLCIILVLFVAVAITCNSKVFAQATTPTSEISAKDIKTLNTLLESIKSLNAPKEIEYMFRGNKYTPAYLGISGKTFEEAIKKYGETLTNFEFQTKEFANVIEKQSLVPKPEVYTEIASALERCNSVVKKEVVGSAENLVGSTSFAKNVEVNNGRISALWMGTHGYEAITFKLKLYPLSQEWELCDGNEQITGINFLVAGGNMNGMQNPGTVKIYFVAMEGNVDSYTLYSCSNVSGATVDLEGRPILISGQEYNVVCSPISHMTRNGIVRYLLNGGVLQTCSEGLFRNDQCGSTRQ